jgi:hypothetical protein
MSKTKKYKCFKKTKNEGPPPPHPSASVNCMQYSSLQELVYDMSHQQSQTTAI